MPFTLFSSESTGRLRMFMQRWFISATNDFELANERAKSGGLIGIEVQRCLFECYAELASCMLVNKVRGCMYVRT